MSANSRDWEGVIGGVVIIAVGALALAAAIAIPALKLAVLGLLQLQEVVLRQGLARLLSASGIDVDIDALPMRLAATVVLYGSLIAVAYLAFLAGSHLTTVIIAGLIGATIGLAMTVLAAVGSSRNSDPLSSLRFWGSDDPR